MRQGVRTLRFKPAGIMLGTLLLALLPGTSMADAWNDLGQGFDAGAHHARYWEAGWATFYSGSGAWALYDAHTTDSADDRYDDYIDAGKSLLGLVGVALYAPPHPAARQRFQTLRASGDAPALAEARDLMAGLAASEARRRRWQARLGGLLVNGLAGLAIGVEDNRPRDGWVNFATGMLTSELNIRTRPWEATDYTERHPDLTLKANGGVLDLYVDTWLMPTGAAIAVRF